MHICKKLLTPSPCFLNYIVKLLLGLEAYQRIVEWILESAENADYFFVIKIGDEWGILSHSAIWLIECKQLNSTSV